MDNLLFFVFIFIMVMAAWIIALFISRAINKKKLTRFRLYISEHFPEIDPEKEELLIAKQKSKQIQPDIALLIPNESGKIILILERKGEGLTHQQYNYADLDKVQSSDQVIGRGLFPKTYSYEETLRLSFKDGENYSLILENLSNHQGNDQGADVVRTLFAPWKRKLSVILRP